MAWDAAVVNLSSPHYTDNTITTLVQPFADPDAVWWLTGVYGPQADHDKIEFLQELLEIRDLHAGPWVVTGDFNLLVDPDDKNNSLVNRRMMARFKAKLNVLELKEVYLNDRRYTCSNERVQPTLEKIDHIFCTTSWEEMHPHLPPHHARLGSLGSLSIVA